VSNQDISLDYNAILKMASKFVEAFDTLQAAESAVDSVKDNVKDAALVGVMGMTINLLLDALNGNVKKLRGVCAEMAVDLNNVVLIMRDSDTTVSSKFSA
jgi:molecular chaperone GrpE (heat shock protein)